MLFDVASCMLDKRTLHSTCLQRILWSHAAYCYRVLCHLNHCCKWDITTIKLQDATVAETCASSCVGRKSLLMVLSRDRARILHNYKYLVTATASSPLKLHVKPTRVWNPSDRQAASWQAQLGVVLTSEDNLRAIARPSTEGWTVWQQQSKTRQRTCRRYATLHAELSVYLVLTVSSVAGSKLMTHKYIIYPLLLHLKQVTALDN